ncbi:PTS-dependent dihydroxyacetone kinase 1, dihydroxyacetone-binding subunit DhaK-like [Phymastichus coffea]|uniref:PTS-dependent dihydroxyacetone kinase 1, dihydroxyacetone-binding subunit DhaK-like n=1 Tax=Phymastichus coffea TaxID=108790 RepID=UPI00273ACF56|nr:PTS-dependent dihydroxyacetone kinase 1, dihydroxyacetone-binding subunit DhaK-like [Phymastichus coffea]
MSVYDPLQKHKRLWNDPNNILVENLAGTMIMHQNLLFVDSCKAVLRRDYNKLDGKVRIIGGGALIDGPMYAGFVGPGMLTAAVLGLHGTTSSMPSTDSIFEVINYVSKDEHHGVNGILLLVHDCAEYFLNFLLAKTKAESKGIPIKMVLVRDQLSEKLNQKPLSPRSPSGLLFIYKIAGAMSEAGKSLDEIYETCDEIIKSGAIFSIGGYIGDCVYNDAYKIEISRGDRLSDRDIKRFSLANTSTKNIVETILDDIVHADSNQLFSQGSKLALLFDYFGGFSHLEVNILMKELVEQLDQKEFEIETIISGSFHTSLEVNGFHLSILNLSSNPHFKNYLNAPTVAFSWPKTIGRESHCMSESDSKSQIKDFKENKTVDDDEVKVDQEMVSSTEMGTLETDTLLTAVQFACEALIACAAKIDMLDEASVNDNIEKCGTRLANIASAIKNAIHKKQLAGLSLSNIIFQIARIFEQYVQDDQAELYRLFFNIIGRSIEDQNNLEAGDWLDAFVRAINAVDYSTRGTKFSDTLFAAKAAFCDAYAENEDVNVIDALGQAVCAAQKQTSHVMPDSGRIPNNINENDYGFCGLAGAHAIGVWMRGAYEGIKLKYSYHKTREKRPRIDDFIPEDVATALKMPKLSLDHDSL